MFAVSVVHVAGADDTELRKIVVEFFKPSLKSEYRVNIWCVDPQVSC